MNSRGYRRANGLIGMPFTSRLSAERAAARRLRAPEAVEHASQHLPGHGKAEALTQEPCP